MPCWIRSSHCHHLRTPRRRSGAAGAKFWPSPLHLDDQRVRSSASGDTGASSLISLAAPHTVANDAWQRARGVSIAEERSGPMRAANVADDGPEAE